MKKTLILTLLLVMGFVLCQQGVLADDPPVGDDDAECFGNAQMSCMSGTIVDLTDEPEGDEDDAE